MNKIVKENGIVIGILIIWLFVNFIILMLSKSSEYSKEVLYPFTDNEITNTYDSSEFLVYGVTPVILFVILQLISYEKN